MTELTDNRAARLSKTTPAQRKQLRKMIIDANDPPLQAYDAAGISTGLTAGQQRLWRTQQQYPGLPIDVVCQAIRFSGSINPNQLADDLCAFVARHEALRITFDLVDDVATQTVRAELAPDLRRCGRLESHEQAHEMARHLAAEPFDLSSGPLLRAVIAVDPLDAEADSWLLLVVHNLVFDAWSFEVLLDELSDRPTRPAEIGFTDFARWQADWVRSPRGRAAEKYWAQQVTMPLPLSPAAANGFTDAPSRIADRCAFTLPIEVATGLADLARAESCTPFTVWSAVLGETLAVDGSDEVLFGAFAANREQAATAGLVGYLLNVVPIRLTHPGSSSLRERVRRARGPVMEGQHHLAYPADLLGMDRFEVVFVFDNLGVDTEARLIQGRRAHPADVDKRFARYDLTVALYIEPGRLHGWLEYDTGRYDRDTVAALVERFTATAIAGADDPDVEPT